jgi:selenocysteine lyase/cysteine desulfurase
MADPAVTDWGWWRERRPSAGPLHLDTAAAGRSSQATLAAAAAHAEREATAGAYVAQEEAEPWALLLPGIVTTAAVTLRAPRDMTEPVLRVSPHVDCTAEDLDRLRQALLALG